MRMFFLLVVLVMGVAVTGYFRGWYTIRSTPSSDGKTTHLDVNVNNVKWQDDRKAFLDKASVALRGIEKQLAQLKANQAHPQNASPEKQQEIAKQITDLQASHQQATDQLSQLQSTKQENWDNAKGTFERTFSQFWQHD